MKKYLLLPVLAFLCLNSSFAQCVQLLTDPSFEGTPSYTVPPPGWISCMDSAYKAALIFPLPLYDTLSAHCGQSYLGLYYNTLSGDTVLGSVSQEFNATMVQGHAYNFNFSLVNFDADGNNAGHDYFEIWLGYYLCDVSNVNAVSVFHSTSIPGEWTNYSFTYYAAQPFTYITLRANCSSGFGRTFWMGVDCFDVCDSSSATGLKEIAATGIVIYPNPTTSIVTVCSDCIEPFGFSLYDLTGREIITRECTGTSNNIDVSQVAKGIYVAKILQAGKTYCQKLIIH